MNECTKKYIKNLPYYRKYTPAVRAVDVAIEELLAEASKALGISGRCFYYVHVEKKNISGNFPNYRGLFRMHYSVYVPEIPGVPESFYNLINPVLKTGNFGITYHGVSENPTLGVCITLLLRLHGTSKGK